MRLSALRENLFAAEGGEYRLLEVSLSDILGRGRGRGAYLKKST